MSFLICGIIFWVYAYFKLIKEKVLYPSIIFSFMWGGVCLYTALILFGYGENLFLKEEYSFQYMDTYIIYFSIATISAFIISHNFKKNKPQIRIIMSQDYICRLLKAYKWIMWLNFFGGILRIALMINSVGFSSVMDYRLAANSMMMTSSFTFTGIVFKLTAYIQMLANFYISLYGLKTGYDKLDFKQTLFMFILYSPTQMATGGRLFILYFIIFFFGAFFLGRGLAIKIQHRKFFESSEKKAIIYSFIGLLGLVALIAMSRGESDENAFDKFSYITEGMLATEYLMQYYPPGTYQMEYGTNTFIGMSEQYYTFRGFLKTTKMDSIVTCIFTPMYMDFGYWGSIAAIFIIALFAESLALHCLSKLTFINFCIYMLILKIFYESVIARSISDNIPNYELIIIFIIFYRFLFGKFDSRSPIQYARTNKLA